MFKKYVFTLFFTIFTVFPAYAVQEAIDGSEEVEKVFSGTIEINNTQLAFIISAQKGGGVLEWGGEEHEFSLAGLGVGGMGVQKANAVGAVYNLEKLEDFEGTYIQQRAGVTVGKGKGVVQLNNTSTGVIIELRTSAKGAALTIGADGMRISLK